MLRIAIVADNLTNDAHLVELFSGSGAENVKSFGSPSMRPSNEGPIPLDALMAALVVGFSAGERVRKFCKDNPLAFGQGRNQDADTMGELGAALTLREWETFGLMPALVDLPPAEEELQRVLCSDECKREPALVVLLARTVWESLSWKAILECNTDIVIAPAIDEQIALQLAKWLWNHRGLGLQRTN